MALGCSFLKLLLLRSPLLVTEEIPPDTALLRWLSFAAYIVRI